MKGETLQVIRGPSDKHGNAGKGAVHTVEGIFAWGTTGRATSKFAEQSERQESSTISVELYVRRTADVKQRDRLKRSNGQTYEVMGFPTWDADSALTGRDFQWKLLQVRAST